MEVIDRDGTVIAQPAQTSALKGSLSITPNPLTTLGQRVLASDLQPGESLHAFLSRHVENLHPSWIVSIEGAEVPALMWARTFPKHGMIVECRKVLRKEVLQIAAIVAISYFTLGAGGLGAGGLFAAGGAIGGGFLAAASVFVVGSIIVNQMLAPKQADAGQLSSAAAAVSQTYSLAGGNNTSRPYEPIGLMFGQLRVTPDFSSAPYTWFGGDDQYLYQVLHGGINCAAVSDIRVGQTPLSSYTDVVTQTDGFSGMPQQPLLNWSNVDSIAGGEMQGGPATTTNPAEYSPGPWVTRTTSLGTAALQADFTGSLYKVSDSGALEQRQTRIEGQYRFLPGGDWVEFGTYEVQSATTAPLRLTYGINTFSVGQFEVRFRKCTPDITATNEANTLSWSTMKSVQYDSGYYAGIGRFGLQIKASGQLSGTLDTVSWLATAKPIPIWNGAAWGTATAPENGLSNPAANILQYLRGYYGVDAATPSGFRLLAGMGLSDSQIDIASIQAFMLRCTTMNFRFDWYIDSPIAHSEVLANMAAAGMGSMSWSTGKLGVVWFAEDEPVAGVVNMATMKAGSFRVDYVTLDTADGIEYQYYDAAQDYSWQTLRVADPGVATALAPAKISSVGINYAPHAALLARFSLGQSLFQRKTITYDADLEHLTYRRGSVLMLTHDVTQWGFGGRLHGAAIVEGAIVLELDDVVTAGSGTSVGLRVPGELGYRIFEVDSVSDDGRTLTLDGDWPTGVTFPGGAGNAAHDTLWLYDFKATPGYRVRVTDVQPQANMEGATITCVPDGPEFWNYVLYGAYAPATNASSLRRIPTASALQITEELQRQGNTFSVKLTATFAIDGQFDHAEIWGVNRAGTPAKLGDTRNLRFSFAAGLDDVWSLEVRPFDGLGRLGISTAAGYTVVGLRYPPADVPWFEIEGDTLTWGTVGDVDLAGYLIRYHYGYNRSWGDAHPLHAGLLTQSPYTPDATPQGPLTLMIRAIDTTGNLSVNASVIQTQFGDVLVANVVEVFDFQAGGYAGTLTGGSIVAGRIEATNTAVFYGADEANFYSQFDTDPFYTNDYSALSYETAVFAPSIVAVGSTMTLDADFAGDALFIEYRAIGTDLMYGPRDSELFYGPDAGLFYGDDPDYRPWPGQVTLLNGLYQLRFRTGQGATQGVIATCRAVIDVPDVVERFSDVVVPVGGTRMALSKQWYEIDNVQITLEGDGGTAVSAAWIDKSVSLGPLIRCLNSAGASVAGTVDVILQGK